MGLMIADDDESNTGWLTVYAYNSDALLYTRSDMSVVPIAIRSLFCGNLMAALHCCNCLAHLSLSIMASAAGTIARPDLWDGCVYISCPHHIT